MILIFNCIGDPSALKIIELCKLKEVDYFQIEDGHNIAFDNICIENGVLTDFVIINKTSGKTISKDKITGFFYRKGQCKPHVYLNFYSTVKEFVKQDFADCLTDEWNALLFYIFDWIEHHVPSIGSYNNTVPNKLKMLQIATQSGFAIPDSYIFSNSKSINTLAQNTPCITKSIQDVLAFEYENNIYRSYTSLVNTPINNNNRLFPSLIQKRVNSQYEIRIFYFKNHIYSAAIAHDKINSTKVDYRNSEAFPDIFPYVLTKKDEKKLKNFIQHCGYNSGSIDLLLSDENELFFLEINPVGQLDFVSDFCGKNIEIDIINFFTTTKLKTQ
jgi:hypothetical protein